VPKKLVILDRDGVINHDSPNYIKTVDEFVPLNGAIDAIANLTKNGFFVAVATNQSGIGRGFYSLKTLQQMHDKLRRLIREKGGDLGEILYCPHLPDDNCRCRKPQPQMLQRIIHYYGAEAKKTYFVGDSLSDIKAAQNAGCKPILVTTGKGEQTLQNYQEQKLGLPPFFADLQTFSSWLIKKDRS